MTRSKNGGNKKPAPKSAFAVGGKIGSPEIKGASKDNRHWVIVEGIQNGVVVLHFKKFNCDEDPFWTPYAKFLDDNPEVKEELGINAIVYRKGEDGSTALPNAPGSEYSWKQLVILVGEDQNTAAHRKEVAQKIISHFNEKATHEMFRYPRKAKFGRDVTSVPPRPVDGALLDREVIGLIMAAYPDVTPIMDLTECEDIMETFWTDVNHGAEVMESYVSGADGENEE